MPTPYATPVLQVVAPALVGVAVAVAAASAAGDRDRPASADVRVLIGERPVSRPLRGGFVGVSLEMPALLSYAGRDPNTVNPVFEQLLRNLAPGQEPVVRLGGDSADASWVPAPGVRRPRGVSYTITRRWLRTARRLAQDLGARMIVGVDLQAGSRALAAAQGGAFVSAIGGRYLRALEIGNEANRYPALPYYRVAPHHPVFARSRGYDFASFAREFATVAPTMPAVPLAGPTVGGLGWLRHLRGFLAAEPRVGVATFHRYPLNRCFTEPDSSTYPTIARLLSSRASRGLVEGLDGYVALAHRHGVAFRVDEMNSVACGGKRGVSDTFASALWALDTLFSMAQAGVDGVNVHTFPGAAYQLFGFRHVGGRWVATVRPEYYGLMMFAQAAPPGSRLVSIRVSKNPGVRAWATIGTAGRLRVVLINDDPTHGHVVAFKPPSARPAAATVEYLRARSVTATSGLTLGGRSFGASTSTGTLAGAARTTRISPSDGTYTVTLPAAGAALVTVPRS